MKRRNRGRRPESKPGGVESELMTLYHVANYLKLHYMTVYRLIKTRSLPAFRLGSDFRVWRSDLEQWIAQQHVPAGKAARTTSLPARATTSANPDDGQL